MTFGTGTLRTGSTGDGVTELQQWLIDRGFLIGMATPSGTFDAATDQAVQAFQLSAGIGVDGEVGPGTRAAAETFTGSAASTGWHDTAVRNVQVTNTGGSFTTTSRRGVLHTTEGSRLPTYTSPPHFTVGHDGAGQPVQVWQHYPVTVAARALEHPSGTPQTNRYGAIQIEIIAFAEHSPTLATDDPATFAALRELMRWIEANAGVARVANHPFGGEEAFGVHGATRLSDAAWAASTGWVGHQHVPHNHHWDPGRIDIAALLAVPATSTAPTAPLAVLQPTTGTGVDGTGPATADPGSSVTLRAPTIRATTRSLSNAFPSLTFAVDPAGLPYFDVLLTTDRALFAPDQAGRRSPQSFYAARTDHLLAADEAQGRYIAPVSVIQDFAEAHPDGGRIYYTVIGYRDATASAPVPAAQPADLVRAAPYVEMMPGFRGHTRTETLGVPLSMLRPARSLSRIGGVRTLAAPTVPAVEAPAPTGSAPDPAVDRAEGEDGYDYRRRHAADGDHGPGIQPAAPAPRSTSPAPAGPVSPMDTIAGYDDGWGSWEQPAVALDSTYPASWPQPHALTDTDDLDGESYDAMPPPGPGASASAPASPGLPPPAGLPSAPGTPAPPGPSAPAQDWRPAAPTLTADRKREVIETFVGTDHDLYAAISPDGAFSGSEGTDHPAYQRYHTGLAFGIVGFSQDAGSLGQLLTLMNVRDPAAFTTTFGPDNGALLEITNRVGPLSKDVPGGRSVRVQPVGGADLWQEPWLSRFVAAGAHRPFQGAQIELSAGMYLDPVIRFASDLGLATDAGMAVIFDRAAHRGVPGGLAWVIETVGPLQTPALLSAALQALGFSDVEAFQRSQPDLLVDDQFGPLTHAAITGALRTRAEAGLPSPVPLLDEDQMMAALGKRAAGQPWGDRIVRLVAGAAPAVVGAGL